MDVKNCSTESQATLYNFGGHHFWQILFYSLTLYSSLLSQIAIYSKKIIAWPPEKIWTPNYIHIEPKYQI